MKFDFNEANILKQNLFDENDTKETLIERLTLLLDTTKDDILRRAVCSLIQKTETMTTAQIKQIRQDIIEKRFIATANFDYGK